MSIVDKITKMFSSGAETATEEEESPQKSAMKENLVLFDSPVPDFIPYAFHYNADTVVTKNGYLLQVIKIEGFSYEKIVAHLESLKQTIRDAIASRVQSDDFSFSFHTIRQKKNLDTKAKFDSQFAQILHDSWVKSNQLDAKYVNDLHITVLRGGISLTQSTEALATKRSLKKSYDDTFAAAYKDLESATNDMVVALKSYNPQKLKVVSEGGEYHSELLRFFSKIIHLENANVPLATMDLSEQLAKYKIAFGYDALEVEKVKNKFFASILSLKNPVDLNDVALSAFLNLPQQMVISQCVNYIPSKSGLKAHKYQQYVLKVSQDAEFLDQSGLTKVIDATKKGSHAFCDTQITIMLIADSLEGLESSTKKAYETLSEIGVATVREDLNLEHCFWSQLPGNFFYTSRKAIIPSSTIGNFASLGNFPFGTLKSKWGEQVTILKTVLGTPYFFNFHVEDNGHTIIVGDDNSGKATLLSFFITEALKFKPKVMYLDSDKSSELYIKAIGGAYKTFSFDKQISTLKLNPLLLEDNQDNRTFLKYWFIFLLDKYLDVRDMDKYLDAIDGALAIIFEASAEDRRLRNVAKFFKGKGEINKAIIEKLSMWYGEGSFAHIFDNDTDDLISEEREIFGIDMTNIYDTPMGINLPVLNYLLHYFKVYFTSKRPSILGVLNGNRVFNNIYFEKNIEYILEDFKNRNSVAMLTASFCSEKVNWSDVIGRKYNQTMATKIFLAENSASYDNIARLFELSHDEVVYLESLSSHNRQFIIKQGNSSIVSELDFMDFPTELSILSGKPAYVKLANEAIAKYGEDPKDWFPKFYEQVKGQ